MKQLMLEERKQIGLDILLDIHRICQKHQIPYYLGYGSLLGAVRHKGFIPWDDDVDIWVPVADYRRFLAAIQAESKYEALDWKNKKNAWSDSFAKISDSRTVVKRTDGKPSPYRGVAVDVFPLMPLGDSKWMKGIMKSNRMVQRLIAYRFGLFDDSALTFVRKTGCKILLLLRKDEAYWNQKVETAMNAVDDSALCGCPISAYGSRDSFSKEWFEENTSLEFEGHFFQAPLHYDEVLTNLYHDYMTPPPLEKQISNHDVAVFWR